MREAPVAVLQAHFPRESHITETIHHAAAAGIHIKGPVGDLRPFDCYLSFDFKFPEMGCLDPGWSLLAGKDSVGLPRPHWCFSCLTWRVPVLSTITNSTEEPKTKLYFPVLSFPRDFNVKCPHVASCQICLDLAADTLLVECQLHLIPCWAIWAEFPAVCVYSFRGF